MAALVFPGGECNRMVMGPLPRALPAALAALAAAAQAGCTAAPPPLDPGGVIDTFTDNSGWVDFHSDSAAGATTRLQPGPLALTLSPSPLTGSIRAKKTYRFRSQPGQEFWISFRMRQHAYALGGNIYVELYLNQSDAAVASTEEGGPWSGIATFNVNGDMHWRSNGRCEPRSTDNQLVIGVNADNTRLPEAHADDTTEWTNDRVVYYPCDRSRSCSAFNRDEGSGARPDEALPFDTTIPYVQPTLYSLRYAPAAAGTPARWRFYVDGDEIEYHDAYMGGDGSTFSVDARQHPLAGWNELTVVLSAYGDGALYDEVDGYARAKGCFSNGASPFLQAPIADPSEWRPSLVSTTSTGWTFDLLTIGSARNGDFAPLAAQALVDAGLLRPSTAVLTSLLAPGDAELRCAGLSYEEIARVRYGGRPNPGAGAPSYLAPAFCGARVLADVDAGRIGAAEAVRRGALAWSALSDRCAHLPLEEVLAIRGDSWFGSATFCPGR